MLLTFAEYRQRVWPYVLLARPDHWFKNTFMLLGVALAAFYKTDMLRWATAPRLLLAVAAACLVASSNYVLNELLDGPRDALHPLKRNRPVPSGLVHGGRAAAEWIALGASGLMLALAVNPLFALATAALWLMGVIYNVPPIRTKEWPYIDVLTESANNAIRLWMGWFAVVGDRVPPLSLTLAYWMVGAFFMGAKRLAEYRQLSDPALAAAYRSSFAHYTEDRLLVSLFFYSTACAFFAGIFIVRYHAELVLFVPVAAALFAYYFKLALQPNSAAQAPEALYKQRRFVIYAIASAALFFLLMFLNVPVLYDWFNIDPASVNRVEPLWTIGPGAR